VGPAEERLRLNEMLDALVTDYRNNGRRSLSTLIGRLKPVRDAFGLDRAVDVSAARIEQYKDARLTEKTRRASLVTSATVNRELAALRKAFRLAVEQGRLSFAPVIRLFTEQNAREGFVEPDAFERVVAHLPNPIDEVARFGWLSGWRKNEILTLEWSDVTRDKNGEPILVTLRRVASKTGEPRELPLVGQLADLVERRWQGRQYTTPTGETALSRYLFHTRGHRVVDFRKRWQAACAAAGVPGLLFHDLRRSAVRHLEKAGVSQAVAMKITGHKTDSVYRRYRIVDDADRREALRKMQATIKAAPATVARLDEAREARQ
jgi:integrase